jgi:hypothetical protein
VFSKYLRNSSENMEELGAPIASPSFARRFYLEIENNSVLLDLG